MPLPPVGVGAGRYWGSAGHRRADPRTKVTVPAMLDIAYLALMLACLAGCVFLVDRLSRSDESATSPGAASRDTAFPDAQSPTTTGAGR